MNTPTPEQISKLPKWAQEHIKDLTRELIFEQDAKRRLLDQQQVSPFYVREWNNGKQPYKRYICAQGRRIEVEHAGVKLGVFLASEDDGQRPYGIELKYSAIGDAIGRGVAIVPSGFPTINLQAVANIR